jgi:hypothetical protein
MHFVGVGSCFSQNPTGCTVKRKLRMCDIIPNDTFFGTFVSDIAVSVMEVNALHC